MGFLTPDWRADHVHDLRLEILQEAGLRGLLIDIDDTLVPDDWPGMRLDLPDPATMQWLRKAQSMFRVALVSNTHSRARAAHIARELDCPYVHRALKPLPFGFRRALKALGLKSREVVVIGDRFVVDMLGGKLLGARTFLVQPLS